MAKVIIPATHNVTKNAFLNRTARMITFNFTHYYVPPAQGDLLDLLYQSLNRAIDNQDMDALGLALQALEPYKTSTKVDRKFRQTRIVNSKTGEPI